MRFQGGNGFWDGTDVTIDIYDIDGTLIGTGTDTATGNTITITLSDTITAAERPDIRRIEICTC